MRTYIHLAIGLFVMFTGECVRADCPANAHVTIVFGNGIETTRTVAQNSLDNVLAPAILQALPPTVDQSCISFVLAYDSKFVDINNQLTSTANFISQLADAGVQQGIDFAANFWSYWYSTLQPPTWFQNLQRQFITQTASIFQPDLLIHEAFYSSELALGHKVIVVAHSQGNLYVNQAYDAVTASGSNNLFHVVAVATPAIHVAGSGPYFTLHGDIILLALGLPPNITNDPPSPCPTSPILFSEACHSFDDSYMDAHKGDNTRPAIVNAVLSFLQATPKAFAFVANGSGSSDSVWSYTVDAVNGTLTPVVNPLTGSPGFSTPGAAPGSFSIAADPIANFVYVANLGFPISNGNVSGYRVDAATGVLTPVNGSAFSAGVGPISVAIHPTGKFIYVGNEISGDVSAYTIDSTTGTLTPIQGSPFFSLSVDRLGVDPLGRFLIGLGADVKVFRIDPTTGELSLTSSSPAGLGPISVAVDPTGKFVYVVNISGNVSAYTLDSATGALAPIAGSPFLAAASAFAIAVDPTGKFVYVANANPSDSISAYTINPSTGALTAVVGSPFLTQGCPALSVSVDVSAKFVYVGACGILGYSLDSATGALKPLGSSPFPGGVQPLSIAISRTVP